MRGNLTLAKQQIAEYDALHGSDFYDEDEEKKIAYVRLLIESENYQDYTMKKTYKTEEQSINLARQLFKEFEYE